MSAKYESPSEPAAPPAGRSALRVAAYVGVVAVAGMVAFFVGRNESPALERGTEAARAADEGSGRSAADEASGSTDDGALLSYHASHPHWGEERIEVAADGTVDYLLQAPERPAVRAELTLDGEALEALRQRIVEAQPCGLHSERSEGRPNESQPTLQLGVSDARCTVTLWFDEWHELADARATMAIVSELRVALAAHE